MFKNSNTHPERHTIIWLGLLVGLGFYIADIFIDVFVFQSGTFQEEILNPSHHEMWMRTSVFILAVSFSIYVQILIKREHESSERAKTAEGFLNSVVDNIPSMVFIKDAKDLRFVRINHAGEQLLGLNSQEIMGKNDHDFFPESQAAFFTATDREVLESGVEMNIPEEEIDTVNLGRRWLHTRKVPILDNKGKPLYLLGISEDITEARQFEEGLRRQQHELAHVMRLSTMGEMASGLAHELNQPLAALTSYCGTAAALVKSQPSLQAKLGEILERAEEQAHRAGQIVRHLRNFLRKEDEHKEPLDLDQVIAGVVEFIKPELRNGHVKMVHQPGIPRGYRVRANKVQVEQVLVNLVLNSLEAIRGSGKATGNIIIQTRQLSSDMIEVTVADDGPGIAADIADRMFNPFQTNKPSGMGMGLTISRSIIEEYEGKLWADLQYENGALFRFNLPVSG